MKKFTKFLTLMTVMALSSVLVFGQTETDKLKLALMEQEQSNKASIEHKGPMTSPEVIECPPGAILSCPSTTFANAYTSAADPGYNAATPYSVTQSIGGLFRVWGLRLWFNGTSWAECFEDPMEFEVAFWDDNGGQPGTIQQSFVASVSPTDIGEVFAGFPMWQWDFNVPFTVNLLNGWVSVQATANNTDCWWLWVDAPDYAGTYGAGLQWDGTAWGALTNPTPLGHCFSAGMQLTNDVGVSAIPQPVSGVGLTNNETVEITIFNYGTAPQGNFDVSYSVNGGTPVTETFTGTIAGGASTNYTFSQGADLSAIGSYAFEACTYLTGDENAANDCATKTVSNNPPALCAPTYSNGCSFGDGLTYFDIDNQYTNATGCDNNAGTGWSQYLGLPPANLIPGMTYDATFATGYGNQGVTVWIDFNDDYTLDVSEIIIDCFNLPTAGSNFTTSFVMPAGATPGTHQMRAMANWQPTDPCPYDPCGSFTYGETEDYMVTIVSPTTGTLEGYVYEFGGTTPIQGATVDILGFTDQTDATGFYQILDVPTGTWDATASHPDYCDQTVTGIVITENNTTTQNFELQWAAITTVPDPAVGYDVVVGENQSLMTSLEITNTGNCDLVYDISLTGLTEDNFGGQAPNNELIAVGKQIPQDQWDEYMSEMAATAAPGDVTMTPTINPNPTKPEPNDLEEIFGSDQNSFSAGPRQRGNFFEVTTTTQLAEVRNWLNLPGAMGLVFGVYECPTPEGIYNMIAMADVSPQGPGGPGWYSSGALSGVTLQAGYYYAIIECHEQAASYYNEQNISPYPIPASFGNLFEGFGWNYGGTIDFPPPASFDVSGLSGAAVAYYQTIVTGPPLDWFWLDWYSGTVAPGATEVIPAYFSAVGYTQGTVKTALLEIESNAHPNKTTTAMDVIMTVGAPQTGDLSGYVYEFGTSTGIDGATVTIDNGVNPAQSTTTAPDGYYEFLDIYTGTYNVEITAPGFFDETGQVDIFENQMTVADWYLTWAEMMLTPNSFTVILPPDMMTTKTMTITNDGTAPLTYNSSLTYLTDAMAAGSFELVERGYTSTTEDLSPAYRKGFQGTEAVGDIVVEFNLSGPAAETQMLGGEFDGTNYWATGGNSGSDPNQLYKFDGAGNLIGQWDQPAAATSWGIRDLAWDASTQTLYGGCEAGLFAWDPVAETWSTVFTGNLGIGCIRALAYVPTTNTFFTKSFGSALIEFDIAGTIITTIPDAQTGPASACYGAAWDSMGEMLWLFDQSGTPQTTFFEFDITTNNATGTTWTIPLLTGSTDQIAGGAWYSTDAVGGLQVLGGVTQGTPDDMMFGMELGAAETWLLVTGGGSGTVAPGGGTETMTLQFDATGLPEGTMKTADLTLTSDARFNPVQVVPCTLIVQSGSQLDMKVYMEGPYNDGTGMMNTFLLSNGFIPLAQPYNPPLPYYENPTPFWLYAGAEAVAAVPADIVDWVMVEIRDAASGALATGATMEEQFAAFLRNDGQIVDLDGTSYPLFTADINDGLFVVVYHRNHAAVMNAAPIPDMGGGMYAYDFTTALGQAHLNGHKEIAAGVYGMFGGEGNGDKQINTQDKLDVWAVDAAQSGYLGGDFNLDGQSNTQDKVDVWSTNAGQSSQVPN